MKEFILKLIEKESSDWKVKPKVISEGLQDSLLLVFGQPRTVIFAHMDTVGFTVRYQDQLVPIGGPEAETGWKLKGEDVLGPIECTLQVDEEGTLSYDFPRGIVRGTSLVFDGSLKINGKLITSPYMDNRMGLYSALKVAATLEDGAIAFSTHEEHGGGSVPVLLKYLMENFPIQQALISDITWVTEGVEHGKGVVLSMRDRNIPRKLFINRLIELAEASGIRYQLEVEGGGSSDGREVQVSPYPIDWCFIGAPEDHVHSPNETVHIDDLQAMVDMYKYLMERL